MRLPRFCGLNVRLLRIEVVVMHMGAPRRMRCCAENTAALRVLCIELLRHAAVLMRMGGHNHQPPLQHFRLPRVNVK